MANSKGSDAKSNSRRCFTFVNVTTPTAPKAVLPTKFAVAEKHMNGFSPGGRITSITAKRKIFLVLRRGAGQHLVEDRFRDAGLEQLRELLRNYRPAEVITLRLFALMGLQE